MTTPKKPKANSTGKEALREEIEYFFLGLNESFIDPQAAREKLLALINREKRKAARTALITYGEFDPDHELLERVLNEMFPSNKEISNIFVRSTHNH